MLECIYTVYIHTSRYVPLMLNQQNDDQSVALKMIVLKPCTVKTYSKIERYIKTLKSNKDTN